MSPKSGKFPANPDETILFPLYSSPTTIKSPETFEEPPKFPPYSNDPPITSTMSLETKFVFSLSLPTEILAIRPKPWLISSRKFVLSGVLTLPPFIKCPINLNNAFWFSRTTVWFSIRMSSFSCTPLSSFFSRRSSRKLNWSWKRLGSGGGFGVDVGSGGDRRGGNPGRVGSWLSGSTEITS